MKLNSLPHVPRIRFIAGLAIVSLSFVFAADKPVAVTEKRGEPRMGFTGKVVSVDATAMTLTLANPVNPAKTKTYQVNAETQIVRKSEPSTLKSAVVGEGAVVQGREVKGALPLAVSISLGWRFHDRHSPAGKDNLPAKATN